MTIIHIPLTQFSVTVIGLGYYMILLLMIDFPLPIMRLLQSSLWMKVYNVGAHKSREEFEATGIDKWTGLQFNFLHFISPLFNQVG